MAIEHIFNKDPVPLYVGFEDIDADLRAANEELYKDEFSPTHFPVHNIYRKDTKYYVVMHTPGFRKDDLEIKIDGDLMFVKGKKVDPFTDAKVVYAGLNSPSEFSKNYRLADDLDLESIAYEDGVLTVTMFKVVLKAREGKYGVNYRKGDPKPVEAPKENAKTEGSVAGPADNIVNEPVKPAVVETLPETVVLPPVVVEVEPPKPEPVVTPILVNADVATKPTVEVVPLDPMPQVVSVEIVKPAEPTADVGVVLKDATFEVKDNVELVVVPTEAGKSDVVVAVTPEVKAELETKKVDIVEVVGEAIKEAEVVPVLPSEPTVDTSTSVVVTNTQNGQAMAEVSVPVEPTQVLEVKVENTENIIPKLVVTDVSEKIPENAELVPVITPEGQPDAVIAVTPEVKEVLETKNIDPVVAVEEAMKKIDSEITTVIEPAHSSGEQVPTTSVEVVPLDPMPQVVSVELNPNPTNPDVPSVVLKDATVEVKDNVELVVVPTEAGKSDVVVAIEPEVKAELEAQGVSVENTVAAVIESEKTPAESPVLPTVEPTVESVVVNVETTSGEPKVDVIVPEEIPSVVKLEIADEAVSNSVPTVVISDTSEKIPENAELIPVVTKEGQPDIIVAVEPEVKAALETANVDIAADISAAVVTANVDVTPIVATEVPTANNG